jgi:predicted DNA-binding protein (UPF0251 family)
MVSLPLLCFRHKLVFARRSIAQACLEAKRSLSTMALRPQVVSLEGELLSAPSDKGLNVDEAAGEADREVVESGEEIPSTGLRRRRHGRPPSVEQEWYSKTEAASYLGVAEITVTRHLQKATLHAQRLPPAGGNYGTGSSKYDYGRLRIRREELDRWLEDRDRTRAALSVPAPRRDNPEARPGLSTALAPLDNDEVITREEAALRLGVSWRTIKRYIESGQLRLAGYFRCPDSYTRACVYRAEVEELLHQERGNMAPERPLANNRDGQPLP